MADKVLAELTQRVAPNVDGSLTIKHELRTLWPQTDLTDRIITHGTVDIPVSDFQAIAALPANQRVDAYIEAIRTNLSTQKIPLPMPAAPVAPSAPANFEIASIIAYIEAYEAWEIAYAYWEANDYADWLTEYNANNALTEMWTINAYEFVEALAAFEGYPIRFTLYDSEA